MAQRKRTFDLTPNYGQIFRTMIGDAESCGRTTSLLTNCSLTPAQRAQALRSVQRFLAPLAIAACSMTTLEEANEFRRVITGINSGVDTTAAQLEAADEAELEEDNCTCDDRSWYGPEHDSACPLAGRDR